jgi:nucleoside-diphosphate-sugar epimerase
MGTGAAEIEGTAVSRVVVIGATGHVGGYLVPRLVAAGHEVVAISRGLSTPYRDDPAWESVQRVALDREAGDADGTFGAAIADLNPDVVIDMVCFTRDSAEKLVDAIRGRVDLLISCGTIWIHGPATAVPVAENEAREAFGDYGTQKSEIEEYLLAQSRDGGVPAIVLHPGHITGPGWRMINAAANLDLEVWRTLATGETLTLPNFGLETVHHVHADDVAQAFQLALENPGAAVGKGYHVVSERAVTLRGIAEAAAGWFGQEADLRFVPFDEFRAATSTENADATWEHIARSPSMSIESAKRDLGYAPNYTSLESIAEGLQWLIDDGQLDVGGRELRAS